jgi:hypothetical protein
MLSSIATIPHRWMSSAGNTSCPSPVPQAVCIPLMVGIVLSEAGPARNRGNRWPTRGQRLGVTWLDSVDSALVPTAFVAVTLKR